MPDFTVVAIVAAYNEEDIVGQVVRALIAEGVQVYFIDNASTDRTVQEVEPHLGRGVIAIEQLSTGSGSGAAADSLFRWETILRRKEALGQTLAADWFIHHDADEFRESPWRAMTLRDAIHQVDAAGFNAIDFEVFNFPPTMAALPPEVDVREAFTRYEPPQEFDRLQIKCWKKTDQPVDLVASGGHDATFPDRRVFPIRFLLRHYPIRGQAHGERKILRDRRPRFAPEERARHWHVQYDDYTEGQSLVKESSHLIAYDPDAARLQLFLRNRTVEELERTLSRLQQHVESLEQQSTLLQRNIEELNDERDRLNAEIGQLHAQGAARQAQLEELHDERDRLKADAGQLRAEAAARQAQLEALEQQFNDQLTSARQTVHDLREELGRNEARVAELLESRSWRVTAPLRAAQRLLRGR
jgi:hypothetical protein